MPKLSQYVRSQTSTAESYDVSTADQKSAVEEKSWHARTSVVGGAPTPEAPGPSSVASSAEGFALASKRFQEMHSKRIREHGPRRFRWPDGSLRPERPPPNPYAVSNRRKYAPLVRYCRTHGGDKGFDTAGGSWRYGIGVGYDEHLKYLQIADLVPEEDENGEWIGFDPSKTDPLLDPAHALNSYYKEGTEEVFRHARGRLL